MTFAVRCEFFLSCLIVQKHFFRAVTTGCIFCIVTDLLDGHSILQNTRAQDGPVLQGIMSWYSMMPILTASPKSNSYTIPLALSLCQGGLRLGLESKL